MNQPNTAAPARHRLTGIRVLHSPPVLAALLILTAGLAVGLVVTGAGSRAAVAATTNGSTAGAPAGDATSPTVDTPTAGGAAATGPTTGTDAGNTADPAGNTGPVAAAAVQAQGPRAKPPEQRAANHPQQGVSTTPSQPTKPAVQTAAPIGPIGFGNLFAMVVVGVAGVMLIAAGRMMLRLFAVLGAVVQVVAKVGSTLTVLMGALVIAIIAVVAAHW